ncbi:MAG TPA: UbiA family prenyltransferase [Thermoanaerobaculia bacterium]|jgi:4-hydroxybenzoate polyprenyltransferase
MTNTNIAVERIPAGKASAAGAASALRYLRCLRPQDILALQGPPLLGAAFAIGRPSAQDLGPLAILIIANVLLVTHIFMLNDWSGLTADFADPNKAARVFTARGVGRREMGVLTASLLVVSLLLFSRLGVVALGLSFAVAGLSALYSLPRFNWKGIPLLNSAAHLAGGILHFLLGYSLARPLDGRGLAMAAFFAVVFAAGHLTQEVRDHQGDTVNGIRTNAVVFGPHRVFAASLVLFAMAQVLLAGLALQGILPRSLVVLVALFALQLHWSVQTLREGLTYSSVSRLQTRYRVLYAVIGAAMVAGLCGVFVP